jgi:hypothetical protein
MPGLFYVPGNIQKQIISGLDFDVELSPNKKTKFSLLLKDVEAKQKNWFSNLVKAGDILWARTNGNPLSISDDMRLAAEQLNLKEKPWMRDFTTMVMKDCPACGTMGKPGYPVCSVCHHIIDEELYKSMGLKKVG